MAIRQVVVATLLVLCGWCLCKAESVGPAPHQNSVPSLPDKTLPIASWQDAINKLRVALSSRGRVVTPEDGQRFEVAARVRNPRFDGPARKPALVVHCATEADVVATLTMAWGFAAPASPVATGQGQYHGLVSVRSGGHSFGGFCVLDNAVVVDLSLMTAVELDKDTKQVRVQPGVTNRILVEWLTPAGVFIPPGGCDTVAMGGYVQGGGWGTGLRQFGLAADSLIEAKIILADLSVVTASVTSHPDLFWALRGGGGGNWGVVTEYTLQAHAPPSKTVLTAAIRYPWDVRGIADAVSRFQESLFNGDPALWPLEGSISLAPNCTGAGLTRASGPRCSFDVSVMWLGSPSEGRRQIPRLLTGGHGRVVAMDAVEFQDVIAFGNSSYQLGANYWHSALVRTPLDPERFAHHVMTLTEVAGGADWFSVDLAVEALGGKVNSVPAQSAAYAHRDARMQINCVLQYTPRHPRDSHRSSLARQKSLEICGGVLRGPLDDGGMYVNDVDDTITDPKVYTRAYYGANYAKLQDVKMAYDPLGRMVTPQGVQLPATEEKCGRLSETFPSDGGADCAAECRNGTRSAGTAFYLPFTEMESFQALLRKAKTILEGLGTVTSTNLSNRTHLSLNYFCCQTENELNNIEEFMKEYEWDPMDVTFEVAECRVDGPEVSHVSLILMADRDSERRLQSRVAALEGMIEERTGVRLNARRRDMEPFHVTLGVVDGLTFPVQTALKVLQESLPRFPPARLDRGPCHGRGGGLC